MKTASSVEVFRHGGKNPAIKLKTTDPLHFRGWAEANLALFHFLALVATWVIQALKENVAKMQTRRVVNGVFHIELAQMTAGLLSPNFDRKSRVSIIHKQNLFCMCLFGGFQRGEDRECHNRLI